MSLERVGVSFLDDDDSLEVVTEEGRRAKVGSGGSIPVGVPVLRGPFNFAYNTAGLVDGLTFYTMKNGDVLLDVLLSVTTAWDGTTPLGDIGAVQWDAAHNDQGYFAFAYGFAIAMDFSTADTNESLGDNALVGTQQMSKLDTVGAAYDMLQVPAIGAGGAAKQHLVRAPSDPSDPCLPVFYIGDTPLSVAVSQSGKPGGSSPGSTQGEASLYIVTATPLAFS